MQPLSQASKRQRLSGRSMNTQSQTSSQRIQSSGNRYYDPDQDAGERRRVRKGLRDLTRDLNGESYLAHVVAMKQGGVV